MSYTSLSLIQIFGNAVEGLFSSDWKARETAVMYISRESVTLLLPYVHLSSSKVPSVAGGVAGSGRNSGAREIQEVCMQVVTIASNDSVLKVFLAALVSACTCTSASLATENQEWIRH